MKLDEIEKKNIYEVPAGYFDKLPGVMMSRVQEKRLATQSVWASILQTYWLRSSLAGLVLLIGIFFVFNLKTEQPTENPDKLIATVSKTEAMAYLLESEQLQSNDLAYLSQTEQDLSYEFIQASEEEIWQEIELADLKDITYN